MSNLSILLIISDIGVYFGTAVFVSVSRRIGVRFVLNSGSKNVWSSEGYCPGLKYGLAVWPRSRTAERNLGVHLVGLREGAEVCSRTGIGLHPLVQDV